MIGLMVTCWYCAEDGSLVKTGFDALPLACILAVQSPGKEQGKEPFSLHTQNSHKRS